MSAITPEVSETSDRAPTFNRPVAPAPNIDRDNELLTYYFDSTWTTKDIAEHFKLSVAVVAAWFQRPDIAALIDFITASSERRARDIARESLPGTIDILLRISRLRNDDKTSRAASSALITFARGRATAKTAAKNASSASNRSRTANSSPPRDLDRRPDTDDTNIAPQSPGRDAQTPRSAHPGDISPPAPTDSLAETTNPPSTYNRLDDAIALRASSRGTPTDLFARAGSATGHPLPPSAVDAHLPVLAKTDGLATLAVIPGDHAAHACKSCGLDEVTTACLQASA